MPASPISPPAPRPHPALGRRRWVLGLLLLGALFPATASEGRLREQLQPIIDRLPEGSNAAVAVYCLRQQRFVFTHNEQRQLRLASVAKVPVSAAALLDLGQDFEFVTSLVNLGPDIAQGSIAGLGIIARGDPALDEHHTERQPDRIFIEWAQALQRQGVRRISGDIVIDNSYFAGPIRPSTYPGGARNIQAWYSAPASAFAWNNNCIEVQVRPTRLGEPVQVLTRPVSDRIRIINRATTQSSNLSGGIIVNRAEHSNTITVSGRYQAPTAWFPVSIHEDPDLLAGDHLAHILRQQGIAIDGQVRLGRVDANRPLLHEHRSGLMGALAIFNQRSQNFYGEQIIRVLGQRHRGEGSIVAGAATVMEILTSRLGLPAEHISLLDGSGLSYDNLSSAWYICQLLARMDRLPISQIYRQTLREQWVSGVRCQVKTGALAVARCLAGYINASPENSYTFTILLNRGEAGGTAWSRVLQNRERENLLAAMVAALKP